MARLKFEQIPGVRAVATSNPLTLLLTGPEDKLKKIKKMTTVRDKGAQWKVFNAKQKLTHWLGYDTSRMDEASQQKVQDKLDACNAIIAEFEPKIVQEYHTEVPGGLEVPAGFWWFATDRDGAERNTLLKPFFLKGLRDYQIECLTEMYKYNRATGCLATGLGKSLIIASLCCATVKAGRRACVVVPTDYLVGQMVETISKFIEKTVGYGGKRKKLPLGADVLVITAASAAKFVTDYNTVIIDESHHSPASTWVDLLTAAESATHVYNLTATAFRADGLDLAIHAFGGPVVYERDTRWGIANGWLKPLKAYIANIDSKRMDGSPIVLPKHTPLAMAYKIMTQNSQPLLYAKKHLLNALAKGRKVLVLFRTVDACRAFQDICKPQVTFEVATGDYKKPLDDFKEGKTQFTVLVSNDRLVSEGIDIPDLDCLISLVQNSSDITTYQAVGRILRKPPGNTQTAIVIDITTNGYDQFTRSQEARSAVYGAITDDVSLVSL